MSTGNSLFPNHRNPVLTRDQQHACERLLALARVRAGTTESALPNRVLNRWSVPLLVGPAGGGKAFVCEEVGRRWGGRPCRRWEVGSWMTAANRSSHTTPEQIQAFAETNPAGCVVYLAGVDALAVRSDHNASYILSVAAEIAHFLDATSARPARFTKRDGSTVQANILVVVGGCFAAVWGDPSIGGPSGAEAWRLADPDPLAQADAVAKWLLDHSRLPAGILRRLAPEPMILHRINREEAGRLAVRLRDGLPPSLDGLDADDFSLALQSPQGWRAVSALIERAWVDGHDPLPAPGASEAAAPPQNQPSASSLEAKPPVTLRFIRLGERLGIPWSRSRLDGKARQLGLRTAYDFETLALARAYALPGEQLGGTAVGEKVSRDKFSDVELAAALLSPWIAWSERAICRGALLLAALLATVEPESIVYEARRARGETVVRHVAWIGCKLHPQSRRWHDLLMILPSELESPAFAPGRMPDDAIRRVLSGFRP